MWHAQVLGTMRALEVIYIRYFGFTFIRLAMRRSSIRIQFCGFLVQFELAFASFHMLIPQMCRRYALRGQTFEAQACVADGAQDDVIVVFFAI